MEPMRIVVAADERYFDQLMVFACSLREHTKGPIELTLLCCDLPETLKRRFLRFTKKRRLSARICEVSGEKTAGFKLMEHLTQATYYRFEIPRIFAGGRVLWADIDTVVLNDLRPFYEQELNGALVAAAPGNNMKKHLRRLGLDESCTYYFNAGGILAIFIANVYGLPLGLGQQIQVVLMATLAAVGTAGVPGAGMIMLGTVLVSVGLPIEGIALIMGFLSIVSPICTATNVLGDLAGAMFVTKTERKHLKEQEALIDD